MLNDIGKFLKKLRVDCGEHQKDMAARVGHSSSFLGQIEAGHRHLPAGLAAKIARVYNFDDVQLEKWHKAINRSCTSVKLDLTDISPDQREGLIGHLVGSYPKILWTGHAKNNTNP